MNKTKETLNYKIIFILLTIAFISPAIVYMLKGGKIINLISSFTFFYTNATNEFTIPKIVGTILFIGIFTAIAFVYYKILKNSKKEFKITNQVVIFVITVVALFVIMLPLTSTDVFYYIGTGWSEAHYGVNPYYTSVNDLMAQNEEAASDEMLLKMKGIWSGQTIVYGPIWPFICKILSGLSMGNLFAALFIYKIFNACLHLVNTYLIYKISNKRTVFTLMYALNPLVLFDGIVNVHNEILVIFFILMGLYFFLKKKNMFLTIVFFALATAVKYFAVLLIPFLVLYYYRKEKLLKKILYSALWAILFIGILVLCYMIYMRDFSVLKGIITQQGKYANSIFLMIAIKNTKYAKIASKICMIAFLLLYMYTLIRLFFTKKQYTFSALISKYNMLLVVFLFAVITNFQSWYTLWLLPTVMWDKSRNIKWLLSITIFAELCNAVYFVFCEYYGYAVIYSVCLISTVIISNLYWRSNDGENLINRWKQYFK